MNKLPQEIVIVGGGTAGWMTACYLARTAELMANNSNVPACAPKITLLESAVISTVGVGEGSTPYLRHFFEFLGINESEWMLKCSATYKMGISFERWTATAESKTTRPLFTDSDSYFHPFFSSLDIPTADMYFNAVNEYRKGASHDINPSHYFTAAHMVEKSITPDAICSSANIDYAYHFDAGLLGDFLKEYALNKGVSHQIGTVANVESH
ncbi:MAG: tryptophan 7-halogenase, partial [Pseudomonadota bacterium]|nr:tryptophan 7-halogenase [Pseudomonadota bacterium]